MSTRRSPVWLSLLLLTPTAAFAQIPIGPVNRPGLVAVNATTLSDLRSWDTAIDRMVRADQLVVLNMRDDPDVRGRRHESLAQYHLGIPVYGGSLSRQTAQGVTVSIIGALFDGISIDSAPTLTAQQAVFALSDISGGRLVGSDPPRPVIFPTLDGKYLLAYQATMSNAKTYVIDAGSGSVLWIEEAIVTQSQVGVGTGVLGDTKKMSTTHVAGVFRTHDQQRPAPIRTFDTRGSTAVFNRLIADNGLAIDDDFSVDADNGWSDPAVVDTHVHTGWTEDYLFKQHGWTGVDNRRGTITAVVHAGLQNNAFFIRPPFGPGGGGAFVYGRTGAGVPITTLDTVGHEVMHGVTNASLTERTGGGLLGALFIDRFGPTSFTLDGTTYPCDTTVFIAPDDREFPALCDAGRYVLASNHGGAINEAFSDAFGVAAEFFHQPAGTGPLRADYKAGEDVTGFGPVRAADVPGSLGVSSSLGRIPHPDHASGMFSFLVAIAEGTRANPIAVTLAPYVFVGNQIAGLPSTNNGGVHWNSTVLSHAFYLAIEGGRNATSGISVQGVGGANRAQIERAFFRAMTLLMPAAPPMSTAALATYQAAVDLYGATSAAARSIGQAMQAVGLFGP